MNIREVYCFYSWQTAEDGTTHGGTTFMNTPQGDAAVVFSTRELADRFLKRTGHPLGQIIPLAALGDSAHPWNPKIPLPFPVLQVLFSSAGDIAAWAADREHFDTAPHVSEIATRRA